MVAEFLIALLRVNLAGGAAVLLVLALRKPAQRLVGAKAAYRLWALAPLAALAVLLPPRTFETKPVDAAPVMAGPALAVAATTPQPAMRQPIAVTAVRMKPAALALSPDAGLAAWLAGVAVSIGVLAFRQHRFAAKLGRMRRDADGVFLADGVGVGPAVVGALTPRVVVPADFERRFTAEERAVVLAHERAHLVRQDARTNGLMALAQCLCWFNPMAHLAGHFVRLDQELACDAEVMARFPAARRRYAEALLKTQISVTPLPIGCYWPARAAHPLEERIAMLKNPPPGAGRRAAGLAATIALCLAGGVAAWASQPAQPVVVKVGPFSALEPTRTAAHLSAAPAAPAAPQAAPDSSATGDWIGTLKSPDLRLAFHIRSLASGGLAGTLDSPDQSAYDLPLDQVTASVGSLSFSVPKIKGTYAAKWDASRRAWIGSWSQLGTTWSLNLTAGDYPPDPRIAGLDGGWDTQVGAMGGTIRIGFNIHTDGHGTHGTMDSPDQNTYHLPLSEIARNGNDVTLAFKLSDLTVTGALSADGQSITGTFKQYGASTPIVLTRRAAGAAAPYPPPHPVAQAAKPPVVDVDAKVLAAYVGTYRFAPGLDMVVTADGGHLFAQITNQTKLEIFASSPTDFFWRQADAQANFAAGDPAPYLVLRQGGRYILGQRQ